MSEGAVQALRENPSWSRMPLHWQRCALWAFYYSNIPPTRDDIRMALVATSNKPTRDYK
jgi:hypothetical protein